MSKESDDSQNRGFKGGNINPIFNLGKINDGNETQRLILKSPSVLMPVFNYVKNNYAEKGLNTENSLIVGLRVH